MGGEFTYPKMGAHWTHKWQTLASSADRTLGSAGSLPRMWLSRASSSAPERARGMKWAKCAHLSWPVVRKPGGVQLCCFLGNSWSSPPVEMPSCTRFLAPFGNDPWGMPRSNHGSERRAKLTTIEFARERSTRSWGDSKVFDFNSKSRRFDVAQNLPPAGPAVPSTSSLEPPYQQTKVLRTGLGGSSGITPNWGGAGRTTSLTHPTKRRAALFGSPLSFSSFFPV